MINTGKLAGRTAFITGASRGIGKAIALKLARDGANIVIAAKTTEPHPSLPGTIYSAAKEIEAAGGRCLPCIVDIRNEEQVQSAAEQAVKMFGGIDILVNNASAISLTGTLETPMKRYDLMNSVNGRGTFLASKVCLPYLKKGTNPHILNISPPLNLSPHWFKNHVAYTMAKYGMSMCVLGMAEEFKKDQIAVNALWPITAISTAAMKMLGGADIDQQCRKESIMADAAYVVLTKDSKNFTGNFYIDEDVLREVGVTDFDQYAVKPGATLMPDFFLDSVTADNYNNLVAQKKKEGVPTQKPAESQAATGAAGSKDSIPAIFDAMKSFLTDDMVQKTGAVFAFNISGPQEGKWFLDLKNGQGACGQGEPPANADVVFTMKDADFVKMFGGQLKATTAYMSGKLKLKGDIGKAMKLERLMQKLQSKL